MLTVLLLVSSFVSGFSLMTLELVSSRVINPLVGSSVYTWTSVIGTTILGLAIGSFLGGYIADRFPRKKTLSFAFSLSAFLTLLVPLLSSRGGFIVGTDLHVVAVILLLSFFLFLLPSVAIGLLQPIILKLYSQNFERLGKEYANVSALWSLGSILGVFLTGYFFVGSVGSAGTIIILSLTLLVVAVLFGMLDRSVGAIFIAGVVSVVGIYALATHKGNNGAQVVFSKETNYYLAQVVDTDVAPLSGRILFLDFDSHSFDTKKHPNGLYTEMYPVFGYLMPEIKAIHVIGAGAYTLPKSFQAYYPRARVSVTEVDGAMEQIGKDYFDLDPGKIKTVVRDARVHFHNTNERYDLVFGDAYNSFISVPWHLMTREFNETVKAHLTAGGLYAINFISALEGDRSGMFQSMVRTFAETFPHYYLFAFGKHASDVQNIVLVGVKNTPGPTLLELKRAIALGTYGDVLVGTLKDPALYATGKGIVLTDDYAPVERLMMPVINDYFRNFLLFLRMTRDA